MKHLEGRSLLRLADFEPEQIRYLLDLAGHVKAEYHRGSRPQRFSGRSLAMLFEKRSTRTRAAFETAFGEEGGHPVFLSNQDIQLGQKETIEDTARVLGRMFDLIEFRGFAQSSVESLAAHSGIPVVNGLTDAWHPTQALADLMTMEAHWGSLEGLTTAYFGDGRNNVSNSLLVAAAKMGLSHTVYCPPDLAPSPEVIEIASESGQQSGATITVSHEPGDLRSNTAVVYTDVWVSMGEESKSSERIKALSPFQVTENTLATAPEAIFLHCLPAVRGNEVTRGVIDGPASRVFDQAENRKHTIKA
ncbi:MAG TPA: ornithine carbamoyltransferase, partial [Alkalispirochaeta sp.]|nr:ornithine carbamoyltransferase [Alkalispirochaeta sp.]